MPSPARSEALSDRAAEALVDRLEQRLAARESALAARERDLQARITELRSLEHGQPATALPPDSSGLERREQELAERERALEERVAAVTRRELAVAHAAATAVQPSSPAPSPSPPPPVAAPAPAPAQAPPPVRDGRGAFNLRALERLVAERGAEHPDRRDEWESYVFFLRDHAAADGSLPPSFDGLVEETFAELL